MRTVPDIKHLLKPLETNIREKLLPALANGQTITECDRAIIELPPRLGGLGIQDPRKLAEIEYNNSKKLTAKLTNFIVQQEEHGDVDLAEQQRIRSEIAKDRAKRQKEDGENIKRNLTGDLKRKMEMAQEVGASNWLTVMPIRASA